LETYPLKFLTDIDSAFEDAVRFELKTAREKFPGANLNMVALMEEVGELAKACLDESWQRVMEEAVQVAVMAQRVATEGDMSLNAYRGRTGGPDAI